MSEIKREVLYRTSDDAIHYGEGALKKAKAHQEVINSRKTAKKIASAIRKVLNADTLYNPKNFPHKVYESDLLERTNCELDFFCETIEELSDVLVNIYAEVPELAEIFKIIDKRSRGH